ncbi:MAG: ATP-binding protein [Clostridia bacterium]|nr:ATP-binding protein [Clostridia bacterium]
MKTLIIEASNDNLYTVNEFIDSFLENEGCSLKAQTQIDLCVEEIFVNIANYAYGEGKGNAEISVENNDGKVTITFTDSGIAYNPLEKSDPDTTLSADERQIGGLGIFLVKKNMDSVSYEYKDNKNIFSMTKQIK